MKDPFDIFYPSSNSLSKIPSPFDGLPSSAAMHGGINIGDKIVSIDDQSVVGMSLPEVGALVSGPEGSFVTLGLVRTTSVLFGPDREETLQVRIRRGAMSLSARQGHGEPSRAIDLRRSAEIDADVMWENPSQDQGRLYNNELDLIVPELRNIKAILSNKQTSNETSNYVQSGNTECANLLRSILNKVSALKAREASLEDLLTAAKESLDRRKAQIKHMTKALQDAAGRDDLRRGGEEEDSRTSELETLFRRAQAVKSERSDSQVPFSEYGFSQTKSPLAHHVLRYEENLSRESVGSSDDNSFRM
ncbi:hypothetical protein GUITHDRAFT_107788 [Guillardia theta CCMP2712]|uniref:PDZ domain-containing protein n=1 Tax=Guillardia theta (strain CCMP2712) TaxID=905079 RepID=L1JDI0_GUITC|nr:hypothetical protein GUITHDRAFT_107788 [Guillardia theta CCMP2712]EKX46170.1 hypothetical protein GUITHDRAFT_107788 [Guillardia theta CCMP2712]|eukprot:XP_005833150.1 hypothetical protein GUITHDRAFT_107788 [Guillardia theta CCMP2712]